jgi:hypothetical protein
MGDLEVDQRLRNDPKGLASAGEDRVGDDPHQAAMAAAIDEVDSAARHLRSEVAGDAGEKWVGAHRGAAIDRESLHDGIPPLPCGERAGVRGF